MTRYKLPEALGGAEARYVADGDVGDCVVVELIDVAPGLRIEIDREHLTEVPPPLPPPPGFYLGTHTKVAGHAVLERDGDDWYVGGAYGTVPWGAVRDSYNRLVPLVPAPEPVELPWTRSYDDGPSALIERSSAGNRAAYVQIDSHLTAGEARSAARALWTAADATEAQS